MKQIGKLNQCTGTIQFFFYKSQYGRGEDNFVPKPQSATVNMEANMTFASSVNGCTLQDSYWNFMYLNLLNTFSDFFQVYNLSFYKIGSDPVKFLWTWMVANGKPKA